MSDDINPTIRPPWWFTAIAILTALPALRIPWLLQGEKEMQLLAMFYPFVIILAAVLAWRCYALGRTAIAWILIVMAWLSTVLIEFI